MKKSLSFLFFLCVAFCVSAQNIDDLGELKTQISVLSSSVKSLKAQESTHHQKIAELTNRLERQNLQIDSLRNLANQNSKTIEEATKSLGNDIDITKQSLSDNVSLMNSSINSKALYAGIVGLIAIIIAIVFFFYHKKQSSKNSEAIMGFEDRMKAINDEQKDLEKGIADASSKMMDVIEKQLSISQSLPAKETSNEPDHSLAIAIANEIARIQQNLNHMDESVKGVSQLKNRAKAILTTLNSKLYEIPDLLGKAYHEGDNMIATMELNEDLDEGTSRIKRVLKPQVSYSGKVIQQAEVVVEYNE